MVGRRDRLGGLVPVGRHLTARALRRSRLSPRSGEPALVGENYGVDPIAQMELHEDVLDVALDRRLLDH